MKLINIYDIDLPRELINIVHTYAKKRIVPIEQNMLK